jgi:hypothetical protein
VREGRERRGKEEIRDRRERGRRQWKMVGGEGREGGIGKERRRGREEILIQKFSHGNFF